jgi:hypothetical protein
MHTIRIDNYSFSIPSCLEELTEPQIHHYLACKLIDGDKFEKQAIFLNSLLGRKAKKALRMVNAVQKSEIVALLDWVHSPILTSPLFEKIEFKGVVYYAPQERMRTSVIAEYIACDNALMSYETEKLYLEKITAFLYRPKDNNKEFGDVREKMNTDATLHTAKLFIDLPITYKIAALGLFIGVKEFVAEAFKEVFEGTGEDSLVESDWATTLMKVAETQTYGRVEDVKFTYMYEIFRYLKLKKQEYQEQLYKQKRHDHK